MLTPSVVRPIHSEKPIRGGPSRDSSAPVPDRRLVWFSGFALPVVLASCLRFPPGSVPSAIVPASFSGLLLAILLIVSAWTDATRGKIFNWTTYPVLLWALAINGLTGIVPTGWVLAIPVPAGPPLHLGEVGSSQCLLGASAGFVVMLFLYRLSGGGAGDVKLAAAIGALVGFRGIVEILMFAYVAAGVFALARGVWDNGPVVVIGGFLRFMASVTMPGMVPAPDARQRAWLESKVRLAPFFAVGTIASRLGGGLGW